MYDETKIGIVSDGADDTYTNYSSVKDCEILCSSMELAEKYEELKIKVMQKVENDYT